MDDSRPLDTRALRLLDAAGIAYTLLPHAKPVFTVAEAAEQRGVVVAEMVKSILLRETGSSRYIMACILGPDKLDHRAVRALLPGAWRRLTFATDEEIAAVTGYPRGAVNPIGLPPDVVVVFDNAIYRCEQVNISSGDLMYGAELRGEDLIRLVGPRAGAIAIPGGETTP